MATPPFDSCGFTLRSFHSWEWSRIDRELSGKIKKDINKKSVRWRFKMNPLKTHRTGLHPLLITIYSPSGYMKPALGVSAPSCPGSTVHIPRTVDLLSSFARAQ